MPEGLDGVIEKYLPFLEEIRKRLRFVIFYFLAFSVLGFVYYEKVINFSLLVFRVEGVNIAFTSPFQFLNLAFSSGLMVAVIASLPLFIYQILSFLRPALDKREFRLIITIIPLVIFLFLLGFFYGVSVMKYVIGLLYQRAAALNLGNLLDVSALLSQIIVTSALLGAAFEFPLVLLTLMRFKIVAYHWIASRRTLLWFVCLVFASLLPPTDLVSLALLTLPLIILFEATLFTHRVVLKSPVT